MRIGLTTLRNYAALCRSKVHPSTDPGQVRAYKRLHRAVHEDPEDALRALIQVSRTVSDDEEALGFLGADALEDLFDGHAEVLLARLELRLLDDEPLRRAARTIWLHSLESYRDLRMLVDDEASPV